MPQLSLYLPDDLMNQLKAQAQREEASLSTFVKNVLERELSDSWPEAVTSLAGAWPDFPTREDLPPLTDDPKREPKVVKSH